MVNVEGVLIDSELRKHLGLSNNNTHINQTWSTAWKWTAQIRHTGKCIYIRNSYAYTTRALPAAFTRQSQKYLKRPCQQLYHKITYGASKEDHSWIKSTIIGLVIYVALPDKQTCVRYAKTHKIKIETKLDSFHCICPADSWTALTQPGWKVDFSRDGIIFHSIIEESGVHIVK